MNPNQISRHSYNADTAQPVEDKPLAEQWCLKRGMTVPESQQPLPRTITVPDMQEVSTVKHIYQSRRLAAASAHGEEAKIVLRERRMVYAEQWAQTNLEKVSINDMAKLQSRTRSRLSLGDPDSVSTIWRHIATTGNQLQNEA